MSQSLLELANSGIMWVFAIVVVLIVLVQSALFIRLSFKEAQAIGYSKDNLKKSFKLGAITGVGPALAGVVAMISMMTILGSPITWMRLSVIGAVPTEMGVASLTSMSLGLTLGGEGFDIKALSLVFMMMAITGSGWLIATIVLTPSMGKMRNKMGKKDTGWLAALTLAITVGLFSNLAAQQMASGGIGTLVAAAGGFGVMYLTHNVLGKKSKGLRSYALAIAMVAGIVLGIVFG